MLNVLENQKVDFAAVRKTKKKGRGTSISRNYIAIQCGVDEKKRAAEEILPYIIHKSYRSSIDHY